MKHVYRLPKIRFAAADEAIFIGQNVSIPDRSVTTGEERPVGGVLPGDHFFLQGMFSELDAKCAIDVSWCRLRRRRLVVIKHGYAQNLGKIRDGGRSRPFSRDGAV